MTCDVIVVGGGAAGLMAAGQAARAGASVVLIERNEKLGRKLLITGKGRCNVTNNCDEETLRAAVRRNPRFLYSAFSAFGPADTMAFFEARGVPLKTERGARVFPVSDKAADIVEVLRREVVQGGVTVVRGRVNRLLTEQDVLSGVETVDGRRYLAPAVLLATGGLSYPATGSTGDGYRLAQMAGHTVLPTAPSLVAIVTEEEWCGELMGLSLKNVTLTLTHRGKPVYSELGEMMFTHFGISGPLVLSASSYLDGDPADYHLTVDLKPGLTAEQLDTRLLRDFADAKNRAFKNALDRLMPRALIPVVVALSGIEGERQVNAVTRAERERFGALLKAIPLTPASLRPVDEAVVTRGGVKVSEVDPKTMQSKKLPGLYFAGELLDLDAVTGGFNLQIAFATGAVAGQAAARAVQGDNT